MARKKLSYREKIALLSEYVPYREYKKGRRVIHNTKVYRALVDIEQGHDWNPDEWKLTKYDDYTGKATSDFLQFENVKVVPSAWYEWHPKGIDQERFSKAYPFRAFLKCEGVTEEMIPYVVFNSSEALSGKFSNIAETAKKGVYIYSKVKPTEKIIVPMVKCLKLI